MKQNIHPQYYPKANVKCACGEKFTVGSTKPEIEIEICSKCHPFYTGREQLIDTAGRVERFKTRQTKAKGLAKKSKSKKT
ncbi:MAG: 50S ribosomal protein L31 [Patescibacteria group bacterium]|nr:50S ribosomal protein L31 [Patescibacteria group bacterium]